MKRLIPLNLVVLITLLSTLSLANDKPNIIVITADDLGYGDVGCYGAKPENIKTPHIDRLAAEGLRFTSAYCSASTCPPSHCALLPGTHAFRVEGSGIAEPNSPALIRPDVVTLPNLLQNAGDKTAVFGKWHLGLGDEKTNWNRELKPGPRDAARTMGVREL